MPGRRVMLIIGASGSIGCAIAARAAAASWTVAAHGRNALKLGELIAQIGPGNVAFPGDLTDAGSVRALVDRVGEQLGRIDAVVDCMSTAPAGILGTFADTDPEAFAPLADVSLVHVQRLAHAALPWLSRDGGTFIAFASDAGRFAAPRQALIGASRGAIMAFVRNFAMDVARDGVRAHCVSPSFVEGSESVRRATGAAPERLETARKRAGLGLPTAADIAHLVLFLCGDGARRITGQVISINGGLNA